MNSHNVRGKTEKFLKTTLKKNPQSTKHAFFATELSCKQVAKTSRQKPIRQNFENLSKCFSRLEVPLVIKSRQESPNFLSNSCD